MSIVERFYAPTSVRARPGAAIDAPDNKDNAIALRRRVAGSAFFSAMQLLPVQRREAMRALYAFCREVNDIADGNRALLHELVARGWRRLDEPVRIPAWRKLAVVMRHGLMTLKTAVPLRTASV